MAVIGLRIDCRATIGLLVMAVALMGACSDDPQPSDSVKIAPTNNIPSVVPATVTAVPTKVPTPAANRPLPTRQTVPASNIAFPSPTPTPTPNPAIEIMRAAREKMGDTGSAAFEISANIETLSDGRSHHTQVTYVGDYRVGGYSSADVAVITPEKAVESRTITILDQFMVTTHVLNASSETWDVFRGYSPHFIALDELFAPKLNDVTELVLASKEEVGGVETHVISGKLRDLEVAGAQGDFDVVFWIGVEDGLLREVSASGGLALDDDTDLIGGIEAETASVKLKAKLSDHGKHIDVVTPTIGLGRFEHVAILLDDGRVLVGGGFTGIANNNVIVPRPIELVQFYSPVTEMWSFLDGMAGLGVLYSTVKLTDGRVLLVGLEGMEDQTDGFASLLDPAANTLVNLTPPPTPRGFPETFLLDDGRVLVVGGLDLGGSASSYSQEIADTVEVFDPTTEDWRQASSMRQAFVKQPLFLLLNDGRVMAMGAVDDGSSDPIAHAEVYDPSSDTWTVISSIEPYYALTGAVELSDGRVLVSGGLSGYNSMTTGRNGKVARVELPDGRQLNAVEFAAQFPAAKIYDPVTDGWTPAGEMIHARSRHTLTLLPDGRVLAAGGEDGWSKDFLLHSTTEIFDPRTNCWSPGPDLSELRGSHSATLLPDGRVLLVGGIGMILEIEEIYPLATSEIIDPADAATAPLLTCTPTPDPTLPSSVGISTTDEDLTCADQQEGSSQEALSVKDVVDSVSDAMAALNSGRVAFHLAANVEEESIAVDVEGDFLFPDRFRFTMTFNYVDTVEIIAIGDMAYHTLPGVGAWSMSPDTFTEIRDLIALGAFNKDLVAEIVDDFRSVSTEVLNGEDVYCITGQASGKPLRGLLGESDEGEGVGKVHFWIGAEDFKVRKMGILADLPVEEGTATAKVRLVMTLSGYGKPVEIQAPDIESDGLSSDDQQAVVVETLETGWVKADIPEEGFSISIPPEWEWDTSQASINLRTTLWLTGRESVGPEPHGVRAHLTLEADELFSAYDSLDEYVEIYTANVAFFADIDQGDIDVQGVSLSGGDAVQMSFSNISPSLGIPLSHIKYILVHNGTAFIVSFITPEESIEGLSPVLLQIAETIATY